jgi:hypothetical protein
VEVRKPLKSDGRLGLHQQARCEYIHSPEEPQDILVYFLEHPRHDCCCMAAEAPGVSIDRELRPAKVRSNKAAAS